jgi:uncharacterized membrane protein
MKSPRQLLRLPPFRGAGRARAGTWPPRAGRPLTRPAARRRQRGAVMVLAAISLGLVVAALGALDIGHDYFVRRELQRTADLAATAGAQTIGSSTSSAGGCAAATASAQQNAASGNGLPSSATLTVVCGRWDPSVNSAPSYFSTSGTPLNAVQVTVQQSVPYFFFGPARTLQASATATATDIRAFSITTAVASLSGGVLNGLLSGLLDASVNLSVASYEGLASAQITLGHLATALGVGTISQLLTTRVTVAQLAAAMVTALGQSTTASATAVTDLGTLAAAIPGGTSIALGATSAQNGLLSVALGDPQAAANATVNVLDMLLVAAEIANGQSAVNLGAAVNLGPLANVTAQLKVIEPPVIAVGEAGQNADGTWRTSAHSAQVRLYLNLNLLNLNLGLASISALNLPLYIEVAPGTAQLESTICTTSQATSQSVILTQPGLASLCVGSSALADFTNTTTSASCTQPAPLTNVSILGYPAITLYAGTPSTQTGLQLTVEPPDATPLTFNGIPDDADAYQSTNSNAVGSVASDLVAQLASVLPSSLYLTVGGVTPGPVVAALLQPLLSVVSTALSPVLSSLDALVVPLLQLLGVQIGVATVHDLGLSCGQAQLVD